MLLTGLPAVLLLPVWLAGGPASGLDDLIYYLPVRAYIGEQLSTGHLPLWNPHVSLGTPLAADPQAGLWYPFTWLFAVLPPLVAYSLNLYAHYVLAGWGMYRFLRAAGRAWQAALLGAVAFEFCPYLISHREHLTIFQAVAWLPWLLFAWQSYAKTGERRFVLMGTAFWGIQLLVQHIQPSIMTAVLLGAYVMVVLRPHRPQIVWAWLGTMAAGGVLAAVQLLPTWYLFASSGRGSAAYYVFIENSWVLSSGLMFLFPMLFGNSTPNSWGEAWWGISHLSEQWPYPTLTILVLALTSLGLIRRRSTDDMGEPGRIASWNRELVFWWGACAVALVIALGDATPLSKLLFHIPVYRGLRVPARWILVWSVALPVLASFVMDAVLRGGAAARRSRRSVRMAATLGLPILMGLAVLFMWAAPWIAHLWGDRFASDHVRPLLERLGSAVRRPNVSILVPLIMAGLSIAVLLRWTRARSGGASAWVFAALIVDLACVVPFVAVDSRAYSAREILAAPALAREIKARSQNTGHRLLVPRASASYARPLEVLWPQSNLLHHVSTLNGYGPLGDAANRLLLRFMPWGSGEAVLSLLRNPALLQRLGVGYIAVRSDQERALFSAAVWPEVAAPQWQEIASAKDLQPVGWEEGLLWPVRVDIPGIYELELDAGPIAGSSSRWFVHLETADHHERLSETQALEPADLSCGPRRMRFLFLCQDAPGAALLRVKSETGAALRAGNARFRLLAAEPAESVHAGGGNTSPYQGGIELPEGVRLYWLDAPADRVWTPSRVVAGPDVRSALEWLLGPKGASAPPTTAFVEGTTMAQELPSAILAPRPDGPNRLCITFSCPQTQLLVFNESFARGWQARIDGKPATLHRVNAVVQGVWVTAGRHEVEFAYRTPGLLTGGLLSGAGWLCLCGLGVFQTWHRKPA